MVLSPIHRTTAEFDASYIYFKLKIPFLKENARFYMTHVIFRSALDLFSIKMKKEN